jgi:TolB protein
MKQQFLALASFLTLTTALLPVTGVLASAEEQPTPSTATKIAGTKDFLQHLSWSPDGQHFLVTRIHKKKMALWTVTADGKTWKEVFPSYKDPYFDGHWAPDSKKIVFVLDKLQGTDGKLQIDVINLDGTGHKNLIPHKAFEESPRWSPDGKRLAWVSSRDKNQEIYAIDVDGKESKRLTTDPAMDNNPCWSPDGKQIAFCSGRKGNLDIWVMNADGTDLRPLTTDAKMDYWPAWSPDGKKIAFTSNRAGNYDIWVMNPDGTGQKNLTKHPAQDNYATWSPDGKQLAFLSNRGGDYNIYVMAVE